MDVRPVCCSTGQSANKEFRALSESWARKIVGTIAVLYTYKEYEPYDGQHAKEIEHKLPVAIRIVQD